MTKFFCTESQGHVVSENNSKIHGIEPGFFVHNLNNNAKIATIPFNKLTFLFVNCDELLKMRTIQSE